jgi:DNA-binding NarL/FixJ family response regulator
MSMRVVIADDHALVRQSIVKAVNSEPGLEVVAEVADGMAALQAVKTYEPDLIVLDIAMPGRDGLAVAEQLRVHHPSTAVLFLSMHDDDASLQRALALGARGFVSKSAPVEELLDALRAMQGGGSYLSSGVATRVMDIAAGRTRSSDLGLTAREREILDLLTQGKRPGEIGDALFLSVKTVKNHLTSVYQKLGVETGTQAVAEAYRLGLAQRR